MFTNEERAWVKKLQKVLDACPSSRLGFYTTGDATVTVYDNTEEANFDQEMDFPAAVMIADADLGWITFPTNVVATVG